MSNTKMLIDATHPEETRVVVQRNGRVEEFDFESAARKLLRGNIYLAKVTRVEPSLQAAFVDYGGNRHGFLAFNEIHPDYYQIPVADRQALLDDEAAAEAELEAAADRRAEALARRSGGRWQESESKSQSSQDPRDIEAAGEHDGHSEGVPVDAEGDAPHIVDVEEDEHIEEVGGGSDADGPRTVAAESYDADDAVSEPAPPHASAEASDHEDEGEVDARSEPASKDDAPGQPLSEHHEAEDDEASDDHDAEGTDDDQDDGEDEDDHDQEQEHGEQDVAAGEAGPAGEGDGAPRGARNGRGGEYDQRPRQRRRPRSYKIQEVIKRRQIILVQVVKEERGNKGAALTTYLSLAGRYTVLMPNTARGGGISRKITNPQDRKRLKSIAQELEVPEGMGLIIRTAGAARTKQEIKRDFEYLLRLWESVRELTLQSTAPSLVYEEGDLVKRSIRDLYNKDVEEVVVAGDAGYRDAADFMRMLMPSHAKNVISYREPTPLFTRYGVERQLNAMFLPQVTLRSGGYIVINQTEALVAIDVNSGKSTREFSIEETALATNLEAADEIARQLKLRDLAGLIVIDFIDMEEKRNNRSVERRLKDALRFDRARIQLGRISHFGLMEMSRQRLRTGVLEGSTSQCAHCQGTGIIRSTESIALAVLRGLEDSITAGATAALIATTTPAVALYILNSKRGYITEMETRYGFPVTIVGSDRIHGANFTVERGAASALPLRRPERAAVNMNWGFEGEGDEAPSAEISDIEIVGEDEDRDTEAGQLEPVRGRGGERGGERPEGDADGASRGRRRRRGRGRGRGERGEFRSERGASEPRDGATAAPEHDDDEVQGDEPQAAQAIAEFSDAEGEERADAPDGTQADDRGGRRRRRGRRGGRRGRGERDNADAPQQTANGNEDDEERRVDDGAGEPASADGAEPAAPERLPGRQPSDRGRRESRRDERPARAPRAERIWETPAVHANGSPGADDIELSRSDAPALKEAVAVDVRSEPDMPAGPVRRRHESGSSEPRIERVVVGRDDAPDKGSESEAAPQRKGWWQRRFGGE